MSPLIIGAIGFTGFLGLLVIGVPIALAAATIGFVGLVAVTGLQQALYYIGTAPYAEISIYVFTVLPLFVLMGHFFFHGGYIKDLFTTAQKWVGRVPGGLAIATVLGGAAFAAASGSSVAASATLGKVCVPEMEKEGYDTEYAAAAAAASANLASMIPPSVLLVLYGVITNASISQLLIGGIFPGIILTAVFSLTIVVTAIKNPKMAPRNRDSISWMDKLRSLKATWGVLILVLVIMGGLYSGIFTPTEAGAAGTFLALIMGLFSRQLTTAKIRDSLLDAGRTTCFVLFIIIGITLFTRFLAQAEVLSELSLFITSLPIPPWIIFSGIILSYLVLGMFIDSPSMLILTLPIFFPAVTSLGYDPILFGVLVVLMCEIGLLTPPVGLNIYVIKGVVPHVSLERLFRVILPYIVTSLICVVLFMVFPQIVTFLPNQMSK